MSDIGNKPKKLIVEKKYYSLFNSMIDILSTCSDISIHELKRKLLEKDYREESINESIYYFLSKNFIELITMKRDFEKNKIRLCKTPELHLREDKKISNYPMIVLNLPLYNLFGLESELKHSGVIFSNMKDEIKKMFENATNNIYICSPFLQMDGVKEFLPILISKAKRGVDIKIISRQIGKNDFDNRYNEIKKLYKSFKEEGATVLIRNYHYSLKKRVESSTHAKLIVCDYQYAYIGSGELRRQSFEKNFEAGIILKGKLATYLGTIFDKLFSVSMEINFDNGEQ